MPFRSVADRDIHFAKHGQEVGARNAAHYELLAELFMGNALDANTREGTRPNTDRVRMNIVDYRIGIASVAVLRSFFIANADNVAASGRPNAYLTYQCGRNL